MIDFVQVQEDLMHVLLSAQRLENISVVQFRKLQLQSEVNVATITTATRNGKAGCGIIVEMPTGTVDKPLVPGPELTFTMSFLVIENPSINKSPITGTQLTAEDVSQIIWDTIPQWKIDDVGSFYAAKQMWSPVKVAGAVAYRTSMMMIAPYQPTVHVSQPTIAEDNLLITLTNGADNPAADIYWTTDGSPPCKSNSRATKYDAPFSVNSGDKIRWAAFQDDKNQSDFGSAIAA